MPESPPDETSAKKSAALEAVGAKTRTAKAGDVLTFEFKSVRKPSVVTPEGQRLHVARRASDGAWSASWVPTKAGKFTLTAALPDTDPVTITVTVPEED